MLRLLIPVLMLLAGLGGGVMAGKLMTSGSGDEAEEATGDHGAPSADDGHGAAPASGGHGDEAPEGDGSVTFVRLNNQFVVPVVRHGTVRSLVVLALTIEVAAGGNAAVYGREPRLRDEFLRVLFAHANRGGFDGSFTTSAAMAPLREGLREAAQGVLGEIVTDVLIVDIVRQDA